MYGKLFESMFTGSMVGMGAIRFAVWSYVVAHTKPDSMVEINPKLLAMILGEKVEDVEEAMEFFCSPDKDSRSKEEEGRRLIREGEYLYFVVNGARYMGARNEDERRAYMRDYMRERRKGSSGKVVGAGEEGSASKGPDLEAVKKWQEQAVKNGADYTAEEAHAAFLSLRTNGWMWGKNPVVDWRAAIESRIQTERSKQHGSKKSVGDRSGGVDRNKGTYNQGKSGLYKDAALTARRVPDAGRSGT